MKEDNTLSSPTVYLRCIVVILAIDAYEEMDVATFEFPWAYLHTPMPENEQILPKLKGLFFNIICQINEELKSYVRIKNEQFTFWHLGMSMDASSQFCCNVTRRL